MYYYVHAYCVYCAPYMFGQGNHPLVALKIHCMKLIYNFDICFAYTITDQEAMVL